MSFPVHPQGYDHGTRVEKGYVAEPPHGFSVRRLGTAPWPVFGDVRGLVVTCGCRPENLSVRLRDFTAMQCPMCRTMIARWGSKIIVANWDD